MKRLHKFITMSLLGALCLTTAYAQSTAATYEGFASYTGTWHATENGTSIDFNVHLPNDKKGIQNLKDICKLPDFAYSVELVSGTQAIEEVGEAMARAETLTEDAHRENGGDMDFSSFFISDPVRLNEMKRSLKSDQSYWRESQRCSDASSTHYFLSLSEGISIIYAAAEVYIKPIHR